VDTSGGHELARLSVVGANCETLADVLVKPLNDVTDYLTQWSGITEELLADVTTTLADAQHVLLDMVDTECILVGHSLENDLRAMKIAHDRVIDTSVCFPRRNGRGGKQALRALADRMLNLQIQTGGDEGHDSTEDASTAMRLALLRLRFGHDDVRIHNYARSRARIEAAATAAAAVAPVEEQVGGGSAISSPS
jgi:RNA exonuclease 1